MTGENWEGGSTGRGVDGRCIDAPAAQRQNNIPVFHPDVQVYEVLQKTSGKHVGLWYFDPYAREGKRSGAWMNAYRNQSRINGKEITTIVSNNSKRRPLHLCF